MKSLILTILFASTAFAQNATVKFNPPPIFGTTNYFSAPNFSIDPSFSNPKTNFFAYNQSLNGFLASNSASANAQLQIDNMYRSAKIDSFNPNGAADILDALVSGAFNLIFNGNNGTSAYIRL
ncbi:hypothetical protein [Flavobacterium sp.]|uniref:hypothetical protein n=1 Tax=Flavobacterium sp. TaxID=239 RepID=UPI0012221ED6|nr:hypothetical protein [Flavobacterium sp.]RZJ69112.1 MAG: hypothetical protein EOO49_18625 [Flavobacterium sp.]